VTSGEQANRQILDRVALTHDDFTKLVHQAAIGLPQPIDCIYIISTQWLDSFANLTHVGSRLNGLVCQKRPLASHSVE